MAKHAPMRATALLILVLGALSVVAAGCGSEDAFQGAEPLPPPAPQEALEGPVAPELTEPAPAPSGPIEPQTPAAAVLASASVETTDAGSAQMAMDFSMIMPGFDVPFSFGMDGAFDFDGQRGTMNLDYTGLIEALGEDVPEAAQALPDQMIMDGAVLYMRFPGFVELYPDATEWIKMDVQELAEQQGLDFDLYSGFNQSDPSQVLQYLQSAGSVEDVGMESIRGVKTTHYQALVDLTKVPELLPAGEQTALEQSYEQLIEQTGEEVIPMDVWIDKQGRARRVSSRMSFGLASGMPGASMKWVMDLFDFGAEVDVSPPPPDQVTDLSELLSQFG